MKRVSLAISDELYEKLANLCLLRAQSFSQIIEEIFSSEEQSLAIHDDLFRIEFELMMNE